MQSQRIQVRTLLGAVLTLLICCASVGADTSPLPSPLPSPVADPSPAASALPVADAAPAATPSPAADASGAAPPSETTTQTSALSGPRPNTCVKCHTDEAEKHVGSIHEAAGVRCVQCHGGDDTVESEEASMAKSAGFIRKIKKDKTLIFQMCASCHKAASATEKKGPGDLYPLSFHAKKVLQENDFAAAVCTDCHGTHDILPRTDPRSRTHRLKIPQTCEKCHSDDLRMNPYGIPTDQFKKYKVSHHGIAVLKKGDSEAAVCIDCHRSHDVLPPEDPKSPIFRVNIPATCGRCHSDTKLMEKHGLKATALEAYRNSVHGVAVLKKGSTTAPTCVTCHGNHTAVPPGFRQVAAVCGRCHTNTEEAFAKSPHAKLKFKGCIECHGNHGVEHPTPDLFSQACVRCHPHGSPAFDVGQKLKNLVVGADTLLAESKEKLGRLKATGYAQDKLQEKLAAARQELLQMGDALHTLSVTETQLKIDKIKTMNEDLGRGIDDLELQAGLRRWSLILVIGLFMFAARLFLLLSRAYHDEVEKEGPGTGSH